MGASRFSRVLGQRRLQFRAQARSPAGVSGRARPSRFSAAPPPFQARPFLRPRRGSDGARPPPLRAPRVCPQRESPGRSTPGVRGRSGGGAGGGASPRAGGGNVAAVAALAAGRAAGGGRSWSRSALAASRDAALACALLPRPPRGAGARRGMRRRLRARERSAPRPPGPPRAPARRARRLRPRRPR